MFPKALPDAGDDPTIRTRTQNPAPEPASAHLVRRTVQACRVATDAASAAAEGILERGNILPLRHSRFVGSEGGRRCEQRQGNNEMFHVLTRDGHADYAHHCQGCQYA